MWVGERILTPGALVRQRSCSIEPGGGILERSVRTREDTDQSLRVHPRPPAPYTPPPFRRALLSTYTTRFCVRDFLISNWLGVPALKKNSAKISS